MTGDDSVIPPVANKKYTINGKEHVFNAQEYTKFSKVLGQTAYKAVENVIKSENYKYMTPTEKAEAISAAYEYAKEMAKANMFKEYKVNNFANAIKTGKLNVEDYAYYKVNTKKMDDSAKKSALYSMYISEEAKQVIFATEFETVNTKRENTIEYAVQNGVKASSYIKAASAMSTLSGSTSGKKAEWFLKNSRNENEMIALYKRFVEGDNKNKRNTIQYASSQGISPKTYLQREIEISDLEEKSKYIDDDVIYENDEIVEFTSTKSKSNNTVQNRALTLINGGYTEDEIAFFWQKENPSDNGFSYAIGIDLMPSAYVEYKSQNFTADKDANGKSISGSKKAKAERFIRGLEIDDVQKIILTMSVENYSFAESEYQRVIDYVNAKPLSQSTKLNIFKELGIKVVGTTVYPQKS
jgi:hypothetical protein